jgi:dTDP-4-dehydrorhamnose reductase
LYGLWFPHHKNELSFVKMLLNQAKAVILSMHEIRKMNPGAKLVQTEDLAKTHSTKKLAYQAAFENKRRWLTNDLLCGKVNSTHYFWNYFLRLGIKKKELKFFLENTCPPDILGFNYYITSERFLDDRVNLYPETMQGGNGRHRYVDTEAVRAAELTGLKVLLSEAWQRFQLPIAITECHICCTREEQMRWFHEAWKTCTEMRRHGVDIRGLTAWSLLGAFDWNSLLTQENKHYEPGVFDLRSETPRKTALGKMISSLASSSSYDHPVLSQKGWWDKKNTVAVSKCRSRIKKVKPLMIIGKTGTLANAFMKICTHRSIPFVAQSRLDVDVSKPSEISMAIERHDPWAIINATGYVKVDEAETNKEECFAINSTAPSIMARLSKEKGIRFMTFSSDLVFDGSKNDPYHEADRAQPLNVYGRSKADGEENVLSANPASLVIRTSAFFGPWDQYNFIYDVCSALANGRTLPVVNDVVVSPTYIPDLVNTALDILIDEEEGIWHLSNDGSLTWAELATEVAERKKLPKDNLLSRPLDEMNWRAARPRFSALISEKGAKLATLDNALERYFQDCCV